MSQINARELVLCILVENQGHQSGSRNESRQALHALYCLLEGREPAEIEGVCMDQLAGFMGAQLFMTYRTWKLTGDLLELRIQRSGSSQAATKTLSLWDVRLEFMQRDVEKQERRERDNAALKRAAKIERKLRGVFR